MIINHTNYFKDFYLEKRDLIEKLRKNIPYFYSYIESIDKDLKSPKINSNNLLDEKSEDFLLHYLVYLKTGLFYMLLIEPKIFEYFLKDIQVIKDINKTINKLKISEDQISNNEEENDEEEVEDFDYDNSLYSTSDIKHLRNKYKSLFLMTYSEENKNNKRISYKTKLNKLNITVNKIKKQRNLFINYLKNQDLEYQTYKKIIKKEAKNIIKLNPSLEYFRILLKELKNLDKFEFIDVQWVNTIEWGIGKLKEIIDILVMYNIRLVIKFVKIYQGIVPNNLNFNDIKHEGILGLMHAIYKFDPFKNWKLSTYASWWIKQHIITSINEYRNSIKIPLYYTKLISEYEKIKKEAENKNEIISDEEIAKKMGISLKKLISSKNFIFNNLNISMNEKDKNTEQDEKYSLEDKLGAELHNVGNIDEELEKRESLNFIKTLVEKEDILNEKEKYIVKNRLEFFTDKPETLESIAFKMKLTKERIRQLENLAFEKIINAMKNFLNLDKEYQNLIKEDKNEI